MPDWWLDMNDTLYILRAHAFGPMERLLAERLKATGVPVTVVVDERRGSADTAPFDKIVLDGARLTQMGFQGLPDNWAWFFGDLCYYLAVKDRPNFDRYCLVESDVFLPERAASPFVALLAAHPARAIAAELGPASERRRYSLDLARFGLDPGWGCIFPLTRLGREVVGTMRDLRAEQLRLHPRARLNDEAILAGAVQRGRHSWAQLEEVAAGHVGAATFATNPPHLFEALAADPDEDRLFHPVVTFETVMERLRTGDKAYSRWRLRKILRSAPRWMRVAIRHALADP
ncbi:hypothetical protein [Rhodobacter sp. NSM]|uniref:hypothetical protein n=1 Tax=Rhodobacter sp. NSM TaxID=3457501 RepID=UPI003FD1DFB6